MINRPNKYTLRFGFGFAFICLIALAALFRPITASSQEAGHDALAGSGQPAFLKWVESEGIPVYKGFAVDDVSKVPVSPWKRYGTLGAIVNLEGAEGLTTGLVWELPPGTKSIPVHHLFDGRVIVLKGTGDTVFTADKGKSATAHWKQGTMFPLPLNVRYQFVNTGSEPARLFAVTNAPVVMDLFRNMDFVFGSDQKFPERFNGEADYFKPEPPEFKVSLKDSLGYAVSRSNLVPDAVTVKLYPAGHGELNSAWRQAGGSGTLNHHYSMAFDSLDSHVEEFQPAVYEIAHRHVGGAYLLYLSGHGYTLLWPMEFGTHPYADGHADRVVRVNWHANTVVIPPTDWFHQHFNPGAVPGRFANLASFISRVYPPTAKKVFQEHPTPIAYEDQDPAIKEIFDAECAKNGAKSNMPSVEEIRRRAAEKAKH